MRRREFFLGTTTLLFLGAAVFGGGIGKVMTPYLEVGQAVAFLGNGPDKPVQVVGIVEEGSVERHRSGLDLSFRLTDGVESLPVTYHGVIPDNFDEGQEVVVTGSAAGADSLAATRILVKCPSKYESGSPSGS